MLYNGKRIDKMGDSMKQIFVRDRNFYKTMVRLSLPAAFQALLSMLVLMADNVMVSRFDPSALAPVSQANSVSTFMLAALNGLGSGAVVLVAQYWGKKDMSSIKRVFAVVCALGLLLPVLFVSVVQLFPHWVVSLVLDPALSHLTPVAVSYLRIVCLSFLPFGITSALVGGLKGVEVVKVTLYAAVISLLSNVVLNALLIFGFGPIPSLGVEGAAIATVLARGIELAVVWVYCFRMQKALPIQPKDLLHHEKWAWKDYLRFGGPVGFTDAQWALVGLMKMSIIGHLGAAMMSAVNMTDTMMNLGTMFTFALAGGACVMVGKAVGAKVTIRSGYYDAFITSGDPTAVKWASEYYDSTDLYWLSRIISAEAKGEPFAGQIAVGNVVLNRVRSRSYPNTIYGVIFDRKHGTQFSPVSLGTIYREPSASSILAAKMCLEGYTLSEDILFFMNPRIATSNWISKNRPFAFRIGNHDFYR